MVADMASPCVHHAAVIAGNTNALTALEHSATVVVARALTVIGTRACAESRHRSAADADAGIVAVLQGAAGHAKRGHACGAGLA